MNGRRLMVEEAIEPLNTLTEQVISVVRASIRDGSLVPGELYSVYQLADQLGVSRSPVRDGLLRLAEVGAVRFERNRGFRVVLPKAQDIAEIFAVRLALEVPAAAHFATNADDVARSEVIAHADAMRQAVASGDELALSTHDRLLHHTILIAAGNERAALIVSDLRETTRLIGATTAHQTRSLHDIEAEHRPLLDAIEVRNPNSAAVAMRSHLEHTGKLLVDHALRAANSPQSSAEIWQRVAWISQQS